VAAPRGTKLRTFTEAGEEPPAAVRSTARAHKPPAKALSARKLAGLSVGGNKLPPATRKKLDKQPLPARVHAVDRREERKTTRTRAGKREPEAGRHARNAEMRDAHSSRRANVPDADPGTRRSKQARAATRP
jgi:hypothetical protein